MKGWVKTLLVTVAVAAAIVAVALFCGCSTLMYKNGGSAGRVGDMTAPIEISDGTDSFTCKLLFGMNGAYWYTRKDSKVTVEYDNIYTNSYIGCVSTRGNQHLKVVVKPLYVGDYEDTNTVSNAEAK